MANLNQFITDITTVLGPQRVHTDELLVKAYSVDASPFEPCAKAVVDIANPAELQHLLRFSRKHRMGLSFRAAGTGVSGQTITNDITVRFVGDHWKYIQVLNQGQQVKAGCCVVGAEVNAALQPYRRFMTADPSSIGSAFIGGMASTNAAGLSCVIQKNIFHTMTDIHFTLMDGTTVDTADPASVTRFRKMHATMLAELVALRQRILDDPAMDEKVRRKFSIRNTAGYSLNAFTDYEDPVEILSHLIIGSEGTLAFIHDITLNTDVLRTERATALVGFHTLDEAIKGVLLLEAHCPMYAVEFLNSVSLNALMPVQGFPDYLRGLGKDACALLLETNGQDKEELEANVAKVTNVLGSLKMASELRFEYDLTVCDQLWNIRRSLFPILAGTRAPEEYAYSEDYCVPIQHLPEACTAFVDILNKYGFTKSGVHGHALHGNIHFSIPLQLNNDEELRKVGLVIDEVAEVVLGLGGALKAEHGTGRAVAPFVRLEWGDDLYKVMQDLKKVIDPAGLLNPGVLLNENPQGHLENLKYAVHVDKSIDTCVDCGFCEYVCPSAGVGLSSRQRIYTLRTIAGLRKAGENDLADRWMKTFHKLGRDMCAVDGLCATRCPLGIDTGAYMKRLRHDSFSGVGMATAGAVASNFRVVGSVASTMLTVVSAAHKLMGHNLAAKTGSIARLVSGMTIPDFREVELTGGSAIPTPQPGTSQDKTVVYYPSCATRIMGYAEAEPLMDVTLRLLQKAGYRVLFPEKNTKYCCGKAFESKGLFEKADAKSAELSKALLRISENGRWPVLCDTSPCLARMKKTLDSRLQLWEPALFTLTHLAEHLTFVRKERSVALHPTCSMREMKLVETFREVAEKCVTNVVIPEKIFCCGFSGDKGFAVPELNASALRTLRAQVAHCEEGYSTSRTCEVGLTLHSGKHYRNILYLVDECTK